MAAVASPSPARLCVGVLSGTSVDAAEAALCRFEGTGAQVRFTLLAHVSRPFPPELVARVLGPLDARALCELDFELGERFAEAALAVLERAGVSPREVAAVGSHGQTVAHLPGNTGRVASTLQIGQASVIAERTGLPVVSDFRTRDVAAGGEGAPLVPYFDWAVLRKPGARRVLLNVGGIANLSCVGDRVEDTLAFDTGPGNMVLDGLVRRLTGGAQGYDRDAALARQGRVLPELLEELLAHPFLHRPPPKSGGREGFGEPLVEGLWRRYGQRPLDLLATAAELTVESVARSLERWVLPGGRPEGVYASGGGTRNPLLMERLAARLAPVPLATTDALGLPEGAKEAACFAFLASEFLAGTPANLPSVTGARRRVVLGKLTP